MISHEHVVHVQYKTSIYICMHIPSWQPCMHGMGFKFSYMSHALLQYRMYNIMSFQLIMCMWHASIHTTIYVALLIHAGQCSWGLYVYIYCSEVTLFIIILYIHIMLP